MRILFWGTPEFALPSLRALESEGHYIAGVVTQPDRPAGRGRVLAASPLKEWAMQEGYRIFTPERPRGEDFLASIGSVSPEVSVVVAYGHLLSDAVLSLPPFGSINVHASLLPELRGAAPINWAIARGHAVTGVTIMRMVRQMDAGPVLSQIAEPIGEGDTVSNLTQRLSEIGAELLVETLALLEADLLTELPQDQAAATFAPKVDRSTARVNWTRKAQEVAWHVRGMDDVPGAWTELEGQPVKLFEPTVLGPDLIAGATLGGAEPEPGTVLKADPSAGLWVACAEGGVALGEVQPAGKARMAASAWLRGRGADVGQRFQ